MISLKKMLRLNIEDKITDITNLASKLLLMLK